MMIVVLEMEKKKIGRRYSPRHTAIVLLGRSRSAEKKITAELKHTYTHCQLTILTLHLVTCCRRSSSDSPCMMAVHRLTWCGGHGNCDVPAGSHLRVCSMRNVLIEVSMCFGRMPSDVAAPLRSSATPSTRWRPCSSSGYQWERRYGGGSCGIRGRGRTVTELHAPG